MPPRRDLRLRADDVLQAIANIEADTAGLDFEAFATAKFPSFTKQWNRPYHGEKSPGSGTSCAMTTARYGRKSYGVFARIVWWP
jgi:hypothetical protein